MSTWKETLESAIDPTLAREIDVFEVQMELRRQGNLDEKIFAETRLRRGIYGQRYDNGHRHDGIRVQELNYPCDDLTKGPETFWDAPGMQRIKIPFGGLTPEQNGSSGRPGRGVLRRDPARDHEAGFPAPLRPY